MLLNKVFFGNLNEAVSTNQTASLKFPWRKLTFGRGYFIGGTFDFHMLLTFGKMFFVKCSVYQSLVAYQMTVL